MTHRSSVGDVVALSRLAWSLAREFEELKGRATISEFREVQLEADDLSEALRLLAETINEDESHVASSECAEQGSLIAALSTSRESMNDLDSFVNRYKVLKKIETNGGFVIKRDWSDDVRANYRTRDWTSSQGDIREVVAALHASTSAILLTNTCLQSELSKRIGSSISQSARHPAIRQKSDASATSRMDSSFYYQHQGLPATPRCSLSAADVFVEQSTHRSRRNLYKMDLPSPPCSMNSRKMSTTSRPSSSHTSTLSSPSSNRAVTKSGDSVIYDEDHLDDEYLEGLSLSDHALSRQSSPSYVSTRRDSETLPPPLRSFSIVSSILEHSEDRTPEKTPLRASKEPSLLTLTPSVLAERNDIEGRAIREAERTLFMDNLFRNSVKLFDDRAALVEFTRTDKTVPDPRFATKMVPVAAQCRICVIRKREGSRRSGGTWTTSIWIFSDDFSVRCQQRLPEVPEPVPLLSAFALQKVSLSGKFGLEYHDHIWGKPLKSISHTPWVNFVFDSESSASEFQSAIFGRKLLASFLTSKTTVHHKGLKGKFAFEEQMCGIEQLRLWEEDGVSLPGAGGGVMALLHLSPSFGESWIKWWINDSSHPVRVKGLEGGNIVQIKGVELDVIHIGVEHENILTSRTSKQLQTKMSTKKVSGMKVEFSRAEDKVLFLALVAKVSKRTLPLPAAS